MERDGAAQPHFIGIDSDGCALDTMESRHRHCFVPAFVSGFGLSGCAEAASQAWLFVNLYSRHRGSNRYAALLKTLELLREHPALRNERVPSFPALAQWVDGARILSADTLAAATEATRLRGDTEAERELATVLAWSRHVDTLCAEDPVPVSAFAGVAELLQTAAAQADTAVISSAPLATLIRQWRQTGLARFVREICGQEGGRKADQLAERARRAAYPPARMLMLGDAPGDLRAAEAVGAWFFPIVPGKEPESWRLLADEGLPRFLGDRWTRAYQDELLVPFHRRLPDRPSW